MVFFLTVLIGHYWERLKPEQSLYLARVDDPGPRFSYYPLMLESARQFRAGYFPLWTSKEGAGFPVLANYQSTPFNPFNLAFEIYPSLKLLDLMVILKLILMGLFTYFFALELGLSPLAGACSAIVICFSGYVSKYISQMNMNTELWLPAGLLVAERMLKDRGRLIYFLTLSLLSALALIGGNPEAAFYFFLFILLYSLFRGGWAGRKQILSVCLSFILGFLLSGYQLLSFIDYLGWGWHMHTAGLHSVARPSLKWAFSIFFPWLFGPYKTHPAQLFLVNYVGLVPVSLALLAVFRTGNSNRARLFFWGYALVFLAVVYQIPPIYHISYLPIFNRIGSFKFAFFGINFSLALLAGYGCDNYFKGRLKSWQMAVAFSMVAALAVLCLLLAHKFPIAGPPVYWRREAWLMPVLLFLTAAGVGFYGKFFEEQKLGAALLLFLALINLLHLYPGLRPESAIDPLKWSYSDPVPPSYLIPMIADPDRPRFTGLNNVLHQNQSLIYGVTDWRVFEAVYPKSYVRVMGEIERFTMEQSVTEFFKHGWSFDIRKQNLDNPLVGKLGIKYLLSTERLNLEGWSELMQADGVFVYRNEKAWPRTWLANNQAPEFGKTRIKSDQAQKVMVSVPAGPGELVLADQYAPGWRARALPSREELKISPESGLFRKVSFNQGTREVDFFYQPWGFRIGLWLSGTGLISLFIGLIAGKLANKKSRLTGSAA